MAGDCMNKYRKYSIVLAACCVVVIGLITYYLTYYHPRKELCGTWYLYSDSETDTENGSTENRNTRDYLKVSLDTINEHHDGKDSLSVFRIDRDKIYTGDSIFRYKISKDGNARFLTLTEIGSLMGKSEKDIQNGKSYTYLFEQ